MKFVKAEKDCWLVHPESKTALYRIIAWAMPSKESVSESPMPVTSMGILGQEDREGWSVWCQGWIEGLDGGAALMARKEGHRIVVIDDRVSDNLPHRAIE